MTPIRIFGKDGCKFCKLAMDLVSGLVEHDQIDYVTDTTGYDLVETTGQRTFPFVFIGEQFIGGYAELLDLYKADKLLDVLEKAGAVIKVDF